MIKAILWILISFSCFIIWLDQKEIKQKDKIILNYENEIITCQKENKLLKDSLAEWKNYQIRIIDKVLPEIKRIYNIENQWKRKAQK